MKKYLLLFLLLGSVLPGFAQGRDTVFAVRKLFREKRGNGESMLATADTIRARNEYAQRSGARPSAQEARQDALASTVFVGIGAAKVSRYSAENETAIIRQYREGAAIPPDIRRKLRRKHFHVTARDVVAP